MPGTSFLRFWAPGLVALGAMLSTCEDSPADPRNVEQQLQGTWLSA